MNIWHEFPLVRVYLAIATGNSIAIISGATGTSGLLAPGVLFLAVLLSSFNFQPVNTYKYRWVSGLILNLLLILVGYDLVVFHNGHLKEEDFTHRQGSHCLIAMVNETPLEKNQVYKTILSVKAISGKNIYTQASGRILTYLSKDSLSAKLHYGDLLIIGARPTPVEAPCNPAAYDYQRYLAANYVYDQVYLRPGTWKKLSSGNGSPITALALRVQDTFLALFRDNGIRGKEYAVASALILGSSDLLDAETRREYSGSGAMHILCVSGLHVAVIFAFLNLILGFMDKRESLRHIKTVILVLAIWFYAAITGFSPAVLRAAWMITFVIIGLRWMRQSNIYNVLAASALLISLADPLIILNVGFQLSYLAVLGIVTLEPVICHLWSPRWWIINWGWKMIAVSLAAQLATFPLACYYFHQFANYFLITNLVAVPTSALVIYAGMAVLIASPVHLISALMARLMIWLLIAMNTAIRWIEEAPGAVSRDVPFSLPMMALVYMLIIIIFMLWISRRKTYVFLALCILVFMALFNIFNTTTWNSQQEFVVYSVRKHTAFCFLSGREAVIFSDSVVAGDSSLIGFTMHPHWVSKALRKVEVVNLGSLDAMRENTFLLHGECVSRDHYFQFRRTKVAVISHKPGTMRSALKLPVDFLIVRDIPGLHMDEICALYAAGQIIFDSSSPVWRTRSWQKECLRLGQKCYSVPSDGAFIAPL